MTNEAFLHHLLQKGRVPGRAIRPGVREVGGDGVIPFTIYPHGLPSEAWLSSAPLGLEDEDE